MKQTGTCGALLAAGLIFGFASQSRAVSWIGETDGNWSTGSNWSGNAVPANDYTPVPPATPVPATAAFDRTSTNTLITIPDAMSSVRFIEFQQASGQTIVAYTLGSGGPNSGPAIILANAGGAPVMRLNTSVPAEANLTFTVNAPIIADGNASIFSQAGDATSRYIINGDFTNNSGGTAILTLGQAALTGTQGLAANIFNGKIKDGTSQQRLTMSANRGSWELTAANTYTGLTLVTGAGTLIVTGSIADGTANGATGGTTASQYDVNVSGGTLAGTGTVFGRTIVTSVGVLAPGKNGIGTLHMSEVMMNSASAVSRFEVANPSSADKIEATGRVTFDGTLELNFSDPLIKGTWTLFQAGSYAGAFDAVTHNLGAARNSDVSFNNTTGVLTVVPEPTSLAAAVLAGSLLMMRRRRVSQG